MEQKSLSADWFMEGGNGDIVNNERMSTGDDNTFFFQKWSALFIYFMQVNALQTGLYAG